MIAPGKLVRSLMRTCVLMPFCKLVTWMRVLNGNDGWAAVRAFGSWYSPFAVTVPARVWLMRAALPCCDCALAVAVRVMMMVMMVAIRVLTFLVGVSTMSFIVSSMRSLTFRLW